VHLKDLLSLEDGSMASAGRPHSSPFKVGFNGFRISARANYRGIDGFMKDWFFRREGL
jgi:hypothetical protein